MSIPQQCQHILPGGKQCGCLALCGNLLCHHHAHKRVLVLNNRRRRRSVGLPPLEDRAAIQMSVDEVLAAFAAHKINRRETATYLYGIQIASFNLARLEKPASPGGRRPENQEPAAAHAPSAAPQGDGSVEDPETTASQAVPPPPQMAGEPGFGEPFAPDLEDHHPSAPQPPSAVPDPALLQEIDPLFILGPPETSTTHEFEREGPFPISIKNAARRRRELEESLANLRESETHFAAMPQDDPNENPPLVLAWLRKNIYEDEAALRLLNEASRPDPLSPPTYEEEISPP